MGLLNELIERADRAGVAVVWRQLPESTGGGVCAWVAGNATIFVDPRLPRRERVEVLAHELAHVRRGHRPRPASLVARRGP